MRLLSTDVRRGPRLREFIGDSVPPYAILSHTWEADGEVTLKDVESGKYKKLNGYAKIKGACRQAQQHGYNWIWIDTCCIDKSSSAELSEAINSMYKWYAGANICYAYLADFTSSGGLPACRWFTRGWTLQELLASETLVFYDQHWNELGTKSSLKTIVSRITHIGVSILSGASFADLPAAVILSWASERRTARDEDMAYCLLGVFRVNMPLLYGEGGPNAFYRLQEEIMRRRTDHSLLLWSVCKTNPEVDARNTVLAPSPKCFIPSTLANQGVTKLSNIQLIKPQTYRSLASGRGHKMLNEAMNLDNPTIIRPNHLGMWMGHVRDLTEHKDGDMELLITNVRFGNTIICLYVQHDANSREDIVRTYRFGGTFGLVPMNGWRSIIRWADRTHYGPLQLIPETEIHSLSEHYIENLQLFWKTMNGKRTVRTLHTREQTLTALASTTSRRMITALYAVPLISDSEYNLPPFLILMVRFSTDASAAANLRSELLYTCSVHTAVKQVCESWESISFGPTGSDRSFIVHNRGVISCAAILGRGSASRPKGVRKLQIEVEEWLYRPNEAVMPCMLFNLPQQYEEGLSLPASRVEAFYTLEPNGRVSELGWCMLNAELNKVNHYEYAQPLWEIRTLPVAMSIWAAISVVTALMTRSVLHICCAALRLVGVVMLALNHLTYSYLCLILDALLQEGSLPMSGQTEPPDKATSYQSLEGLVYLYVSSFLTVAVLWNDSNLHAVIHIARLLLSE